MKKRTKRDKKLKLKKKYVRLLRKIKIFFIKVFLILIVIFLIVCIYKRITTTYKEINIKDNTIEITLSSKYKDLECILSATTPTNNDKWIKISDNKCVSNIDTGYKYLFIKKDNKIKRIDNISK